MSAREKANFVEMQIGSFVSLLDSSWVDFLCENFKNKRKNYSTHRKLIAWNCILFDSFYAYRSFFNHSLCVKMVYLCVYACKLLCVLDEQKQTFNWNIVVCGFIIAICILFVCNAHLNISFHHKLFKWTVLTQTNPTA